MSPVPVRARVPTLAAPPLRAPRPGVRRPTAPSARPPLRLVDDARLRLAIRQRRARRLLVVAAVLVGASLLALAASHAMMISTQVRLDDLDRQVVEAQARHQALRLEVATLEAPDRVVSVAQERLGMAPPDTVTYLHPAEPAEPAEPATPAAPGAPAASTPEPAPAPAATSSEAGEPGTQSSWGAIKPYLGSAR